MFTEEQKEAIDRNIIELRDYCRKNRKIYFCVIADREIKGGEYFHSHSVGKDITPEEAERNFSIMFDTAVAVLNDLVDSKEVKIKIHRTWRAKIKRLVNKYL